MKTSLVTSAKASKPETRIFKIIFLVTPKEFTYVIEDVLTYIYIYIYLSIKIRCFELMPLRIVGKRRAYYRKN